MFNRQLLRRIYIATLSAIVFFMPLSVWLLTFFIIVLVIVWIADGGIARMPQILKSEQGVLISFGTYLVYLLWMINTSDLSFGLRELKMKLPLLIFPLVIGLSDPLNKKEIKTVLSFFVAGVVLSSLIGFIYYSLDKNISDIANPRKISLFISHIRLALMTNFSIIVSAWYYFFGDFKKNKIHLSYSGIMAHCVSFSASFSDRDYNICCYSYHSGISDCQKIKKFHIKSRLVAVCFRINYLNGVIYFR